MGNVELNSDQKSVIWRYMDIWRRWRRLPNGHRRFEDLQEDMAQGYGMLLCGILVEAQASTVITADVKDPKFFAAIFGNDDDAVPDMTADELEQARQYIIHGQRAMPVRKWWHAEPPFPHQTDYSQKQDFLRKPGRRAV